MRIANFAFMRALLLIDLILLCAGVLAIPLSCCDSLLDGFFYFWELPWFFLLVILLKYMIDFHGVLAWLFRVDYQRRLGFCV